MSHSQPTGLPLTSSPSDLAPLPELRLKLLGAPQITLDDVPLTFKRRKAVALLAYLATTGRVHTREALASLLAGETDKDDQARSHLRNTLYDLCGQVGEYLLLTRETIALNPERPCWLDAEALQAAVMALRDPGAYIDRLARAVDLYEGEFLAGFTVRGAPEFEEWLRQERHRLHRLIVQAVELLLSRAGESGDDAGVLSWARRLLTLEPWHEDAHRQIMRVLARTGQRTAALAQYETCRRVLETELGQTPQPETQALYDQLSATPVAPPHNLTLPAPACIGRERDLATLLHRLEDPSCRLITLLGMGGSGKTCLALRAAEHYASTPALLDEHPFADGIYRVRLASARARGSRSSEAAPQMARRLAIAIGRALGLDVCTATDPTAQVLAWLRPKKLLLVIENGERLQAGLAVLRAVVQQAPGVTLLVTSRERLQVPGEWVTELGGLALPRDASQIEHAGASQFFLQQSQQVGVDGALSADDRDHIVQICRLTRGLPLALMLAARWRRGLSCAEIAAELAQGIDLLATSDGGVPERHRSVRAILDASWERLTRDVQAVLRRLAVCENGFSLEAAHAVAGAELAQLLALRDCALLSYDEHGRYVLHELVRRYAAERLASQPDEERDVRALHATYYSGFVRKHADALCRVPEARDTIGREIGNVRTAWAWAVTHGDVQILSEMRQGLAAWYELAGEYGEWSQAMGWAAGEVRKALSTVGSADAQSLLCALLVDKARGWIGQGHYDRARAALQEATALAQAGQSLHAEAYAACYLGQLLYRQGLTEAAQQQLERALALARSAEAEDLEARSLWYLGRVAVAMAEYPQAYDYCVQALSLYRALGDQLGEAAAISALFVDRARECIEQGQYDRAQASLRQATVLAQASQSLCPEAGSDYATGLQAASAQRDWDPRRADAGRPRQDDVGGGSDGGVVGPLAPPALEEAGLAVAVADIERLARREVGGLVAALRHTLAAGLGLDGRRPMEEGLIGDLLLACLVERGLAEVAQAELGQQEGARRARLSKTKRAPYFARPRWVAPEAVRWWASNWRWRRTAAAGST